MGEKRTQPQAGPTRIANRAPQDQALKLRSEGKGYNEIAAVLGYACRGAATNAVQAALTRIPSEKSDLGEVQNAKRRVITIRPEYVVSQHDIRRLTISRPRSGTPKSTEVLVVASRGG
jgi:hypothetical protein